LEQVEAAGITNRWGKDRPGTPSLQIDRLAQFAQWALLTRRLCKAPMLWPGEVKRGMRNAKITQDQ
jgi:hypothetical protein